MPTDVDSGWTSISLPQLPLLDETDNNILALVEGSDSTFRLVKINAATAAIMWKITVSTSFDFHTSRVRGGRLSMIDSGPELREIDTIAGTSTTTSEVAISTADTSSSDDTAGALVVRVNDIGTTDWASFGPNSGGGTITPAVTYNAPSVFGFTYTSQGQLLRQVGQSSGARNGPALGKTRRTHQAAFQIAQTQGMYVGTDFDTTLHILPMKSYPGGTVTLALNELYDGVNWVPIDDPYGFDGMVAWQVTRPYPATVLAVEGFLHTSDR
jgi:hypothetical protein